MSVVQRQIERVSQEMNIGTCDFEADLTEHITQTNNDVVAVRQEMAKLGEQICSKVADGVNQVSQAKLECRHQILAANESSSLLFHKVNQEINVLKATLASKQTSEDLSASTGSTEQNTVVNKMAPVKTQLLHYEV
jgi:hypothetical protein